MCGQPTWDASQLKLADGRNGGRRYVENALNVSSEHGKHKQQWRAGRRPALAFVNGGFDNSRALLLLFFWSFWLRPFGFAQRIFCHSNNGVSGKAWAAVLPDAVS